MDSFSELLIFSERELSMSADQFKVANHSQSIKIYSGHVKSQHKNKGPSQLRKGPFKIIDNKADLDFVVLVFIID